ncbi:putative metalloprotease [Halomicronema hongdechloris C2206]|uniref:Metalloprotease n=1 Tax=Halomicronema hongdechloris C2206 TaxID=1641165 RepID=A0A1Z3HT65_9CYAN|nr:M23 family metallopeptidase [Halomicronema hongdechloris]ASC73475.1 putative metalloprotease [Halomicronema hongdechloris C2206]
MQLAWRRLRRWYVTGLVLALMALALWGWLASPGWSQAATDQRLVAQSVEELQQQQQDLEKKRSRLQQQQDQLESLQDQAETKLDGLEQTIAATANQIAETEYRLEQAEKRLTTLQAELEQAKADYQVVQRATVARLQVLQRQQGGEGWAVLLQSQNFNEFLDRRYQLKRVYDADRQALQTLKAKAEDLKAQATVVEAQKNQVALLRQQLLSQKEQYEAEANQQEQLIGRLRQDRAALEAAEAQLAKDSEQLAVLIRQRLQTSTVVRGTGRMIHPAAARITSRFGTRVHPILGYRRFHSGIDFGASYGTTIQAADAGRVIFSGWYGGYGQAVIIDHGGGITTLYAHASRLYVREGQGVQQGQAIAAVGSTGLSTGPHLHFEVRQNGNPVNPMAYL